MWVWRHQKHDSRFIDVFFGICDYILMQNSQVAAWIQTGNMTEITLFSVFVRSEGL